MKTVFEKIKVRFVSEVRKETQTNLFTQRRTIVNIPIGEVHIFELIRTGDGEELVESMCGKARGDIAENTRDSEKRPAQLPVCKECEAAWKDDPRSPWKLWLAGERV